MLTKFVTAEVMDRHLIESEARSVLGRFLTTDKYENLSEVQNSVCQACSSSKGSGNRTTKMICKQEFENVHVIRT